MAQDYDSIPLVVELYQHKGFGGRRYYLVKDERNLQEGPAFNDIVSSIKVYKGPNWGGEKVELFKHTNFTGASITLELGEYGDVHEAPYDFGDVISSARYVR
ncbi:MAG: beta/gamma crystallin-related protein [Candidatus Methylomirabilales bacterium]